MLKADTFYKLECNRFQGQTRFDPSKAILIFQILNFVGWTGEYESSFEEEYFFLSKKKRYIVLRFSRKGLFWRSVGLPKITEYDETEIRVLLSLAGCPIEIIERHFGRQEIV